MERSFCRKFGCAVTSAYQMAGWCLTARSELVYPLPSVPTMELSVGLSNQAVPLALFQDEAPAMFAWVPAAEGHIDPSYTRQLWPVASTSLNRLARTPVTAGYGRSSSPVWPQSSAAPSAR